LTESLNNTLPLTTYDNQNQYIGTRVILLDKVVPM